MVIKIKFVCLSDTHGRHNKIDIPNGDVLLFCGDFFNFGNLEELYDFNTFLGKLPHTYKIVIAGNHDQLFEKNRTLGESFLTNAIYLQDSFVVINKIKIYGSPWQPRFLNWAFNLDRGQKLQEKWDMIPHDVDILMTHSPPYKCGDKTIDNKYCGCKELRKVIEKIQPKYHIFGHIHEGYGKYKIKKTIEINASALNHQYKYTNKCIIFNL